MKNAYIIITAFFVLNFAPVGAQATTTATTPAYGYLYYCQAQSWVTGQWYWWQSYNLWQARNNALTACVMANGYTCNVACR